MKPQEGLTLMEAMLSGREFRPMGLECGWLYYRKGLSVMHVDTKALYNINEGTLTARYELKPLPQKAKKPGKIFTVANVRRIALAAECSIVGEQIGGTTIPQGFCLVEWKNAEKTAITVRAFYQDLKSVDAVSAALIAAGLKVRYYEVPNSMLNRHKIEVTQ